MFMMNASDQLPKEVAEIHLPEQQTFNGQVFPLVLKPARSLDFGAWCKWVVDNRATIKSALLKYGAIFFRGFPIDNPAKFDAFVKSFGYEAFPYVGGAAVRKVITGNVFTANEAPPSAKIPFHHEMAQVPDFPKVLFFYGDIVPPSGGQTPIIHSNMAYVTMKEREPALVERLEKEGIRYLRTLPNGDDPDSSIGRGWQSTYLTEDKAEAEKKARAQGTEFEWLPDGCLKTITKVLPAVRTESRSNQKTWFNSIIAAYVGWQDSRNDAKKAVIFPNGDTMPSGAMKTLEETLDEISVNITWQKGDVMMVDNRLALHGRRFFTPPRRILACLCQEHN